MTRRKLLALLMAGTIWAGIPTREARAEPISTAIGLTAIFGATVGTAIVTTAISVGLSYLTSVLMPKPKLGASSAGTTLNTTYGGAAPRSAIVGRQATGGQLVYANVYDFENKMLQAVYVLGDGLHDGIDKIWYQGKECALVPEQPGAPVKGYTLDQFAAGTPGTDSYRAKVYVRFFNGDFDQLADDELVTHANPVGRWTSNHRGRGVSYISITQEYDEDQGLTGYPDIRVQMRGLRLYDWRHDSTNGGSGTQRWGDVATYVFSENPSVAEYNYRRGYSINTQLIFGMGVSTADLIQPMYTSAANACDEDVPLADGGTEPRYRLGMAFQSDRVHSEAIDTIRGAMAGYSLERAGQFGPIAGVAQTVNEDFAFSEDDFLVGQKSAFSKYRTRSEIATAIYGKFSDPAQKWEAVGFPGREDPADDAIIGEHIGNEIDLTQIPSSPQAQRVAEITRRRLLVQGAGSCVLGKKWMGIQPGDWTTFNSVRHGAMTVEIQTRSLNPDQSVGVTYREVKASIFSWTTAGEIGGPFVPTGPQPGTIIRDVPSFAVATASKAGDGDLVIPAIKATWSPITDPSVDRVAMEYRLAGDVESTPFTAEIPSAGVALITAGIQAATDYEVHAKLVTTPVRECPWTDWKPVTSGADQVVQRALEAEDILSIEIKKTLSQVEPNVAAVSVQTKAVIDKWVTAKQKADTLLGDIKRVQQSTDAAHANILQNQTLQESQNEAFAALLTALSAQAAINSAAIVTESSVRAAQDGAITSLITALSSTAAGNSAAIVSEASTRASADSAMASDITGLTTTVGGNTASIGTLTTTVDGVKVQFGVTGTINGVTGGFVLTGIAKLDGTVSYTLEIDGDVIVDGSVTADKLDVINLQAVSTHTGSLTVDGVLQVGSKVQIDGPNGWIAVYD